MDWYCQGLYGPRRGNRGSYPRSASALPPRSRSFSVGAFCRGRENADAVVWLRRGVELNRNYAIGHFRLAAALTRLGHLDQARAAAQAGLTLDPNFTIRRFHSYAVSDNPTYLAGRERACNGMRMAEVPEG
jgi:hypothetical protein